MLKFALPGAAAALAFIILPNVARAVPTTTVNGVTFPVGFVANGDQLQAAIVNETLITGPGQTLSGVGFITTITDQNSNPVWADGTNGVRLGFTFNNYVSALVVPPTAATAGQVTFTGGMVNYYTVPANTSITQGSQTADATAIQSGTLFLSSKGVASDAAGDTLISTIPQGSSLTNFANGSGFGFLDVTGGAASTYFATHTFANAFDPANGGSSDLRLTSSFNTGASGDFPVGGTANVKANTAVATPEPASLAVIGTALATLALVRRRRRA